MARAVFAGTLNVVLSVEQSDEGVLGMANEVDWETPGTTVGEDVVFAAFVAIGAVDLELQINSRSLKRRSPRLTSASRCHFS